MKRTFAILLILMTLAACAKTEKAPVPEKDLYILFTSDVHSGVDCGWTYAGVDSVRNKLKADGNHVLLVDNGDSVQGMPLATVTKGEANIELMNAMKYDLATIGNHEFNYGIEQFMKLTKMAAFDYVSCNITYHGELCFSPYKILEADGKKIAFVGVTTPTTVSASNPKEFRDENGQMAYGFCQDDTGEALYRAVQTAVDSARDSGADLVILMAHLGNEAACVPWTYADVITHTTGIDAVLDGHSHDLEKVVMKNKAGKEVLRQGCGTKLEGIGYLRIAADGTMETGVWEWHNDRSAAELLDIQSEIRKELEKAVSKLDEAKKEVVARTEVDLNIRDAETDVRIVRNQETNIGDLCADAILHVSGADIAFLNGGSIRASFTKGPITLNDIIATLPYENTMCVCEATGREILDALEFGARMWPEENGGWLNPASSLQYEVHTGIEPSVVTDEDGMFQCVNGEYRVKNVRVNGEELDPEKIYMVASLNFMLRDQGDGYTMFADNSFIQDEITDQQMFMTYLKEHLGGVVGKEYAEPQGRIRFVEEE